MHCGVLQIFCDLREVHLSFPDQLFASVQLDPAHILTGRQMQMLMKQRRQVAGADTDSLCHQRNRQLHQPGLLSRPVR